MRDRDVIESELRLIAAIRRTAAETGMPMPTINLADELLDELPNAGESPTHVDGSKAANCPGDGASVTRR